MRRAALGAVVLSFGLAGVGWRAASRPSTAPRLDCDAVVSIVEAEGERIACPDDPVLAGCAIVPGDRYRGCASLGPLPGALLVMRGQPIDVNRASPEDLQAIRGVGPSIAGRIVEAREQRPFCAASELQRVKGIGRKRAEALSSLLSFSDPSCLR